MLSLTSEYALRAMACLAARGPGAASSESIAALTNVPVDYLCKIMRNLVLANLVTSQRGPRGGFALARPATSISLFEVVRAVEYERRSEPAPPPTTIDNTADRIGRVLQECQAALRTTTLAEILPGVDNAEEAP